MIGYDHRGPPLRTAYQDHGKGPRTTRPLAPGLRVHRVRRFRRLHRPRAACASTHRLQGARTDLEDIPGAQQVRGTSQPIRYPGGSEVPVTAGPPGSPTSPIPPRSAPASASDIRETTPGTA